MKTSDYSKFKYHVANRPINNTNVLNLIQSIKTHGFIEGRPVLVNKDFVIIDGQHRFEALKQMKLPISYEIIEGDVMTKVIALNNNQAKWTILNYVESWAKQGKDCYRKLLKFEEANKLGFNNSLAICTGRQMSNRDVKAGKEFEFYEHYQDLTDYLLSFSNVSFYNTVYFVRAIVILYRRTDVPQRKLVKDKSLSIPACVSTAEYIQVFENIINRNKQAKSRIKL